jgi:hypothetical protein
MVTATSSNYTDYLLAEFKCGAARARLMALDIETAAAALAGNLVDPDTAMAMIADAGALGLISPSSAIAAGLVRKGIQCLS